MNRDTAKCYKGNEVASPAGQECSPGHYCPAGSQVGIACPIGTYLSSTDANFPGQEKAHCKDCEPGDYCYTRGREDTGSDCEAGYFCTGADDEAFAQECPAGSYCVTGSSAAAPCLQGTYNPNAI